jgi:two-component system response regulator
MIVENKVILLVEDNPNDVALTRRALQKANVANEVVVVEDGVEALEYLIGKDSAERPLPVVTLLDLKLPRIDGLEVLRQLRENERTKRLPVVILTSSNLEDDVNSSYDLGANSYVRKPVKFNEFTEAVRQLGIYWLMLNEPPYIG